MDAKFQALPRHILEEPFQDLDSIGFTNSSFWTSDYIGLGAFRVDHWEPGAFIQGVAFDGFALGRPKIDRLKVLFIGDPNTALANILSGDADFVADYVPQLHGRRDSGARMGRPQRRYRAVRTGAHANLPDPATG